MNASTKTGPGRSLRVVIRDRIMTCLLIRDRGQVQGYSVLKKTVSETEAAFRWLKEVQPGWYLVTIRKNGCHSCDCPARVSTCRHIAATLKLIELNAIPEVYPHEC